MKDAKKGTVTLVESEIETARMSRRSGLAAIGAAALGGALVASGARRAEAQVSDNDRGQHADAAGGGSDSDTGPGSDPPGGGRRVRSQGGCSDSDSGQWADAAGHGSRCR